MVTLPLLVGSRTLSVDVLVIADLCTELLLGNDFVNRFSVNLYSNDRFLTLRVGQRRVVLNYCPQPNQTQLFNITTIQEITIPPRSSRVISATTAAPPMTVFFTPSPKLLNDHHILAPYALLTVSEAHATLLTLLNPSHTVTTIPKGTKLGQVTFYGDTRCCYINNTTNASQPPMLTVTPTTTSNSSVSSTSIFDGLVSHLALSGRTKLLQVLHRYTALFDLSQPSIIRTNGVSHRIPTLPHHQPIQSYPYRRSPKELEIINEQVKEMLDNHIIRPSSSPWSSPVVIIKKKDGTPRFCVDYRRLNAITERDVYPLPRIDDIIDKLAGCQYFSTFDLKSGYWQLPIDENDKNKTAFVTSDGLYEFNVMPFGLSNAPASFQRIMNSILGNLRWDVTLVYLDDIIVYSKSFEQHLDHLDRVLGALHRANVKLNLKKCSFAHKQLDYLGFRITQAGIKPTTSNVRKTIDFPTPTTAKEAYSFVQMAQFYRRFIKDFATIAAPLTAFKVKDAKFLWTPQCQQAFDTLKTQLSQYPLLAFYDGKSDLRLKINTDASNIGIGGVLQQTALKAAYNLSNICLVLCSLVRKSIQRLKRNA